MVLGHAISQIPSAHLGGGDLDGGVIAELAVGLLLAAVAVAVWISEGAHRESGHLVLSRVVIVGLLVGAAITGAAETDTVFLNRRTGPGLRALRTKRSEELEDAAHNVMAEFGDRARVMSLYFGGDLEASIALTGQVAGRIDAVRPVADVIRETAADCLTILERLAARYPRTEAGA